LEFQQDSEIALLSIVINNPELIYNVQDVKHFMFSSAPNQTLWLVIQDMIRAGQLPTVALIDSSMKSQNKDGLIGGKDYLNYISKQSFSPENLVDFEKIIISNYKAKELINVGNGLASEIYSGNDIDVIINKLRSKLDKLTETSGGNSTYTLDFALRETWTDLVNRIKNPGIRGISTGLKSVDMSTYGMCPGKLWIISGRPGMGKSSVMENFSLYQSSIGIPNLMFSLEMNKRDITERLVAIETGIELTKIKLGLITQANLDDISKTITKIKSQPLFIDDNFSANLNYILATSRKYVKTYGVKVIYVDYIQLMAERNSEATHELGTISRAMKLLARELDVCIVVLSQLNRSLESRGDDKRPQLSDLRQSGNLEEDADVVIGLYRDELYDKNTKARGTMEFIISKDRDGAVGMVPLNFVPTVCRLSEDN
jgi:replicative DNA helicase